MNKPPEILVNSGFVTDQNGVLEEIIMPSSVITLQRPDKITSGCTALTWIPDSDILEFTNLTAVPATAFKSVTTFKQLIFDAVTSLSQTYSGSTQGIFSGCSGLQSISMPLLTSIGMTAGYQWTGHFYNCTSLTGINMPALETITVSQPGAQGNTNGVFGNCPLGDVTFPALKTVSVTKPANGGRVGVFYNCAITTFSAPELTTIVSEGIGGSSGAGLFQTCTSLTSVSMPKLKSITGNNTAASNNGCFAGCTGLTTINFPVIEEITNYQLRDCTGLTSVTLGSPGHSVTSLGANTFYGCTQNNLTMTVYTADGNALANSPFGATNTLPNFVQA